MSQALIGSAVLAAVFLLWGLWLTRKNKPTQIREEKKMSPSVPFTYSNAPTDLSIERLKAMEDLLNNTMESFQSILENNDLNDVKIQINWETKKVNDKDELVPVANISWT